MLKKRTASTPLEKNIKKRKNSLTGFTLIELTIVIAIIAILAVVVAVSTGSSKLIGAANKLMFDIRYAQQLAISRQVSCGVSFDPANNNYFVYIGDTSVKATDPHVGGELFLDYDTDREYKGISLVNTNFGDLVSFDYLGTPNFSSGPGGQGIITVQDNSHTQTLAIEPQTGRVEVR